MLDGCQATVISACVQWSAIRKPPLINIANCRNAVDDGQSTLEPGREGGHHPQSCASHSRTDPFLCAAFSAYKRVIADVAIFSVRGRWRKCADARRSNADRAVNSYMMGGGGSARIGVFCEMPRGYMVVRAIAGVASILRRSGRPTEV